MDNDSRRPLFKLGTPDLKQWLIIYTNGEVEGMPAGYSVEINYFPALANAIRHQEGYDPYERTAEHPHP